MINPYHQNLFEHQPTTAESEMESLKRRIKELEEINAILAQENAVLTGAVALH